MSVLEEHEVDLPSLVVGVLVACAGALFLVEPVVGPIELFKTPIRPIALSAIFLTTGFALGAVLYHRRDYRLLAIAHGVGALVFGFFASAMAVGSQTLLFAGVVVLVGGSAFLVAQTARG